MSKSKCKPTGIAKSEVQVAPGVSVITERPVQVGMQGNHIQIHTPMERGENVTVQLRGTNLQAGETYRFSATMVDGETNRTYMKALEDDDATN